MKTDGNLMMTGIVHISDKKNSVFHEFSEDTVPVLISRRAPLEPWS
jgi:hypothetical protein